jgi:hypothetical protein
MKTSFDKFMASSAVQPIKVEMALVDDLKKAAIQLNTRALELKSELDNIKQSKQRAISAYNTLLKFRSDLELIQRSYNQSAKDLGIDIQELPEITKAKNLMSEAMKIYSQEI